MDPVTLGVVAAALAVKSFEKFAEKAGEETATRGADILEKLVGWLRGRFSQADESAETTLTEVERVPDNARLQQSLAQAIRQRVESDPTFKTELEALIGEAQKSGTNISSFIQNAVGDDNVQIAHLQDSPVTINRGGPAYPVSPPRSGTAGA